MLIVILESVFSLSALEASLVSYVKDPSASEKPFNLEAIPKISREQAAKESARKVLSFCLWLRYSWLYRPEYT